ncbi:unnamed protein product [Rhodiola kirilowii]
MAGLISYHRETVPVSTMSEAVNKVVQVTSSTPHHTTPYHRDLCLCLHFIKAQSVMGLHRKVLHCTPHGPLDITQTEKQPFKKGNSLLSLNLQTFFQYLFLVSFKQVSQLEAGLVIFMMSSRYPFTAAQWQELEQQALFFKFTMSGLPIPPHLLFSINHMTQPQHIGWTCFQMGLSSKMETDPEPNRCRRTDGKKWRCSRQVFGDSKYCERHMHRGKCRPRNPNPLQSTSSSSIVEAAAATHSNLSSITSDLTHNHLKAVKDSNFMTFLGIGSGYKFTNQQKLFSDLSSDVKYEAGVVDVGRVEKRQRTMFQFIEESPQEKNDSWLNLVI